MKYKLKNTIFEADKDPICNICESNLVFNIIKIKSELYKNINVCSNIDCLSNKLKLKRKEVWKAFLPIDEYNKISKKMYDIMISNNRLRKEFWINRGYTEIDSIKKISEMQSDSSKKVKNRFVVSKENLKNIGFSEQEIKNICQTPSMLSFWINKGLSEEEAKCKLRESQSNAAKNVDFENRLLPSNLEYWIERGFNKEESKLKVSESQRTFSKEKCIEKYGEEYGVRIWKERQNKWQNSLYKNGNIKGGYSKVSQELFDIISKFSMNCKYATHNSELCLTKNNKNYYYDFTEIDKGKIIEYNGDQYHANPKIYESGSYPHPYRKYKGYKACDIWKHDEEKIKLANENGFQVLSIWDSEFKKNREETIQKCIEFLNK